MNHKYQVIFRGKLTGEFTKEEALNRLSKSSDRSTEKLEQMLFKSGKIVLKKTDDYDAALRYEKTFTESGFKVEVLIRKPKKKVGRLLLISAMLLMVAAGGLYWWIQSTFLEIQTPKIVNQIEDALAGNDLIAMAHANIDAIIKLENALLGGNDEDPLLNIEDNGLLNALLSQGIKPREAIDQILISLNHDPKTEAGYFSLVIAGSFKPSQIKEILNQQYEIEETKNAILFRRQNLDDCSYSPQLAVDISENRIVVSTPEALPGLIGRLNNPGKMGRDLTRWRNYRSNRLASIVLFTPSRVSEGASGILGMMLSGASKKMQPVDQVFAGFQSNLLPLGVIANVTLNSNDSTWVEETTGSWRQALDKIIKESSSGAPIAEKIYSSIGLDSKTNQLSAELTIDEGLIDNIGAAIEQTLAPLFSFGGRSPSPSGGKPEERLDDNPTPFFSQYALNKLQPFDRGLNSSFKASKVVGPMGVSVTQVGISEAGELEFEITAEGQRIENLGNADDRLKLWITSVVDQNKAELLKQESCGKDRNQMATNFSNHFDGSFYKDGKFVHYRKHEGKKSIRLKSGSTLSDVDKIFGKVALNLPVLTETKIVPTQTSQQSLEFGTVRVVFKPAAVDALSYEISGQAGNILSVRALNKDKKHLAKSSSFSSGRFLGKGRSYGASFNGEVAYVEVVFVKQSKSLDFPFVLTSALPLYEKQGTFRVNPIEPFSFAEMDELVGQQTAPLEKKVNSWQVNPDAHGRKGPLSFKLLNTRVSKFWGLNGSIEVLVHPIPAIADNLTALELVLNQMDAEGIKGKALEYSAFIPLKRHGYIMNGVYQEDPERPYFSGSSQFQVKGIETKPTVIDGVFKLKLPTEISQLKFEHIQLGHQSSKEGFDIMLTTLTPRNAEFKVTGDIAQLMQISASNEQGELISDRFITMKQDEINAQTWMLLVPVQDLPSGVTLSLAVESETREYPVRFEMKSK